MLYGVLPMPVAMVALDYGTEYYSDHDVRHVPVFIRYFDSSVIQNPKILPSTAAPMSTHLVCAFRPFIQQKRLCSSRLWTERLAGTRRGGFGFQQSSKLNSSKHATPSLESYWEILFLMLQRTLVAVGISHVITEYVLEITLCEGPSMIPVFRSSGDIVLVEKLSLALLGVHDGETAFGRAQAARLRQDEFPTGDVWHAVIPNNPPSTFPWSTALQSLRSPISNGDIVVAGHPLRTGSICKRVVGLPGDQIIETRSGKIQRVPDGHVWLEGDNAPLSRDSRHYGPIPIALLKGRVVARVWPLRGKAMVRRWHPSSTVLPAGYRGEHISKTEAESRYMRDLDK